MGGKEGQDPQVEDSREGLMEGETKEEPLRGQWRPELAGGLKAVLTRANLQTEAESGGPETKTKNTLILSCDSKTPAPLPSEDPKPQWELEEGGHLHPLGSVRVRRVPPKAPLINGPGHAFIKLPLTMK
ncbi:unnamed protein product [Leuciscus chuanchicus]